MFSPPNLQLKIATVNFSKKFGELNASFLTWPQKFCRFLLQHFRQLFCYISLSRLPPVRPSRHLDGSRKQQHAVGLGVIIPVHVLRPRRRRELIRPRRPWMGLKDLPKPPHLLPREGAGRRAELRRSNAAPASCTPAPPAIVPRGGRHAHCRPARSSRGSRPAS